MVLGLVLTDFDVGISNSILAVLSLIALILGSYSLVCFSLKKHGGAWLKIIIIANSLYCMVTALLIGYFFNNVTRPALAYLFIEITLMLTLVRKEIKILGQQF